MKQFGYLLTLLFASLLIVSCSKKIEENKIFNYSPEKPKPGEKISISYNSDSTNLSSAKTIDLVAYLYSKGLDDTKEIQLQKENNKWVGSFSTSDSTKGVLIKFKNDDDLDNNNKKGYVINLYDNNGNVLPGSYAGLGVAYDSWGSYYLELNRDPDLAYKFFEQDFNKNPLIKKDFLDEYLTVVSKKFPDKSDSLTKAELGKLENEKNKSEDDLRNLTVWYDKIGNKEKSNQYKNILKDKFPQSEYFQAADYKIFYFEKNINKKLALAKSFEKNYPKSKYTTNLYALLTNYYRDKKDYKKAEEFLRNNSDKVDSYRFYSVVSKMLDNKGDLKTALEIAKMGVEKSRKEDANPSDEKPNYYSKKEWKDDRDYLLGLNLYAYGNVLYKMNKKEDALSSLEEAVNLTKKQEVDLNELYIKTLLDNKKYEVALIKNTEFIKSGKSTNEMKNLLKEAYVKKNGSDKGFEKYAAEFESQAKEDMISKLKDEIISKPAPNFSLTDLNGNNVSLSSLKGKTVVLDFWATWCGPCLSSFPGMKKAVEKYSDNDNVKFLFVNAWERVDNKKENAEKFLAKTKYPFHVLLDKENKVIEQYKVSGIPTKFIVDKNGNIRFISVGFSGNTDQMVDEISTMISMVN